MGCDIHLRVEYLAPGETVALKEGEIKVVQADGLEGAPRWVSAEKLTPKEEIEHNKFYLENLDKPDYRREWDSIPALVIAYEDRWYSGRNYRLFANLAGVRGDGETGWVEEGLPDDVSPEVYDEADGWGIDGHSHSHQTLAELLTVDWKTLLTEGVGGGHGDPQWMDMLERMKDLAFERCEGDYSAVRIVYWFDN